MPQAIQNTLLMQSLALEELKNKSLEEILRQVLTRHLILYIRLPEGAEVIVQPKSTLKPLPILEGFVPQGWKEAIYGLSN